MSRTDLNAYFERIGYTGPCSATLETLRALHLHHAQTIPFENLNPLTGRPVPLDLPSVERKLLYEGRGGYCFEQNLLFSSVLRALGFHVTSLAARVLWNAPEDSIRPRCHMLLCVYLDDEPYIADVGFGGQTLTAPLRLVTDIIQETPHEPFRLVRHDGEFLLQSQLQPRALEPALAETWKSLYRFDLQPQHPVDFEVSNWYMSTHPQSPFVSNLMAARPVPGKRYGLFNNQLTVHHLNSDSGARADAGAVTEHRTLATAAEIRSALEANFGLTIPADPAIDTALARLIR